MDKKVNDRPKIVEDIEFDEQKTMHLLTHPLVRHSLHLLIKDFNETYAELQSRKIDPNASDEHIKELQNLKTEIFQAFISGALSARNPDGNFARFCIKHLAEPEKPKSKLIL